MMEYSFDRPTALTCPECGGAVSVHQDGTLLQYRCHIGHVLTAETMLAAQFKELEVKLGAVMVALKERAELCRQLSEVALAGSDLAALSRAQQEALERAATIKQLLESEWEPVVLYDARPHDGAHRQPGA